MYQIGIESFGVRLTLNGAMDAEEAENFSKEYQRVLAQFAGECSVLVDCRDARPSSPAAQFLLATAYRQGRAHGLVRVAVVFTSEALKNQIRSLSKKTGELSVLRFIDASAYDNWEEQAFAWINSGIEPEPPQNSE